MKVSCPKVSFKDDRGIIKDLLVKEPLDAITVISSAKGAVRGNNYHKDTIQWVYLMSGFLTSLTQLEGDSIVSQTIRPGELLKTDVLEKHTLIAEEDSEFLVLTRGPRGGDSYEEDTYRLDKPLNYNAG